MGGRANTTVGFEEREVEGGRGRNLIRSVTCGWIGSENGQKILRRYGGVLILRHTHPRRAGYPSIL